MAILETTLAHFNRGHTRFELTPNEPTERALIDTYEVRLWIHDQLVYSQRHSIRNWQMRHDEIRYIAKNFCCVRTLIGQTLECPVATPGDIGPDDHYLSLVHARMDVEWLQVSLAATHPRRFGEIVHVHLLVRESETTIGDTFHRSKGNWGYWQKMIGAYLFCKPDNAIAFGNQLHSSTLR